MAWSPKVRALAATLVLSAAGAAGIFHDEGRVNTVYLDPVGIKTVCVGNTSYAATREVGTKVSDSVCAFLFQTDSSAAQQAVKGYVKVPITQEQYDALVSFAFNVGGAALRDSTLLRKLNAGQCKEAAQEFHRWVKAKGKVLAGLVTRRNREAELFASGC